MNAAEKTVCTSNPERPFPTPSRSPPSIFSLPNELLVEIAAAGQERRVHQRAKSEWTLSHVSRRFRDAILGAPVLWTFVETNVIHEGSVEIMKLYLERSRACTIRVNLWDHSWVEPWYNVIGEWPSHILPHTHRLSRLSITATDVSIASILAILQDVAVPVLQDLEIEVEDSTGNHPLDIFSSGPPQSLTLLKTVGFAPQFPLPQWMASITHLEISESDHLLENENLIDLASQCPVLIRLYIDTSSWSDREGKIVIPSLKSLHLSVADDADDLYLGRIIRLFDIPALTDLVIDYAHGDQLCALFDSNSLPSSSFPALTSLSFINRQCTCEEQWTPEPISSPPLRLFPALSSLTLINQCFTAHIVEQILGPASQPWPLLRTITVCPTPETLQAVYSTLQGAIRSKREHGQAIPKFRFSPILFQESYWDENGVDVELFDPTEFLPALQLMKSAEHRRFPNMKGKKCTVH
ncbi:hypothetical protein FB451DRAFT_1394216 [Mycena latifolia]|nr:hypothetical protein FB451DRAFT_1394216 [Mycena latifolia]